MAFRVALLRNAKIRTGSRVAMSVASLKAFNEDLSTLELDALAHDELDKLSGQLMLDTANRLPGSSTVLHF